MSNESWITTYTGEHIYPTRPEADKIKIEDIAHALSMICRGNGHVKTFYSVGQHCLACMQEAEAEELSVRIQMGCLLHDASECYMSDVPSPFKTELPRYRSWEDHLLNLIFTKFLGSTLSRQEYAEVKRIDHAMLYFDLDNLLEEQEGEKPDVLVKPSYEVRDFEDVEDEYLRQFIRLKAELLAEVPDEANRAVKKILSRQKK